MYIVNHILSDATFEEQLGDLYRLQCKYFTSKDIATFLELTQYGWWRGLVYEDEKHRISTFHSILEKMEKRSNEKNKKDVTCKYDEKHTSTSMPANELDLHVNEENDSGDKSNSYNDETKLENSFTEHQEDTDQTSQRDNESTPFLDKSSSCVHNRNANQSNSSVNQNSPYCNKSGSKNNITVHQSNNDESMSFLDEHDLQPGKDDANANQNNTNTNQSNTYTGGNISNEMKICQDPDLTDSVLSRLLTNNTQIDTNVSVGPGQSNVVQSNTDDGKKDTNIIPGDSLIDQVFANTSLAAKHFAQIDTDDSQKNASLNQGPSEANSTQSKTIVSQTDMDRNQQSNLKVHPSDWSSKQSKQTPLNTGGSDTKVSQTNAKADQSDMKDHLSDITSAASKWTGPNADQSELSSKLSKLTSSKAEQSVLKGYQSDTWTSGPSTWSSAEIGTISGGKSSSAAEVDLSVKSEKWRENSNATGMNDDEWNRNLKEKHSSDSNLNLNASKNKKTISPKAKLINVSPFLDHSKLQSDPGYNQYDPLTSQTPKGSKTFKISSKASTSRPIKRQAAADTHKITNRRNIASKCTYYIFQIEKKRGWGVGS